MLIHDTYLEFDLVLSYLRFVQCEKDDDNFSVRNISFIKLKCFLKGYVWWR